MAAKIKKGDKVVVLVGKDKGKTGEVIEVRPSENRAVVRGVNIVRHHQRVLANVDEFPPNHCAAQARPGFLQKPECALCLVCAFFKPGKLVLHAA